MNLTDLITRARVLATSALTWLTAIAVVLSVAIEQLDDIEGVPDALVQWLVRAAAFLAVVILQVRRVTPVDDSQKGLLPPKGPAVEVEAGPRDAGEVGLTTLFLVVALVLFLVVGAIGAGWIDSQYVTAFLGFGLASWVLSALVP